MSFSQKIKIIDNLLSYANFIFFYFSGGEVFTIDHFIDVINYIPSNKGSISISTNGTLIEKNRKRLERIDKEKIRGIMVSIAGASEKTHQYIRGIKLKFVLKNISILAKLELPFGIAFDVYKANVHELESAVKLAIRMGAQCITFTPIENIGGRADYVMKFEEFLNHCEYTKFINKIKQLEKDYQGQIIIGNTIQLRDKPECKRALSYINYNCSIYDPLTMFITPSGEVHSCYPISLVTNRFFLGKLPSWNIHKIIKNKIAKISLARRLERNVCKSCKLRLVCDGHCLTETLRQNKEYFVRNCRKNLSFKYA